MSPIEQLDEIVQIGQVQISHRFTRIDRRAYGLIARLDLKGFILGQEILYAAISALIAR